MASDRHAAHAPEAIMWKEFIAGEEGATSIEYALISSLVSIVILSALIVLRRDVSTLYDLIDTAVGGS